MSEDRPGPVLVLGNGGWGTALAMVLAGLGRQVGVWGRDPEYTRAIEATRRNPKYLPGVVIPEGIRFDSDAAAFAPGAAWVLSTVPTQRLRAVLTELRPHLPRGAPVLSGSKGFERETLKLPSQVIAELLPGSPVAVLSGPSHAEEVSRGLPTAVVAAAEDPALAAAAQLALNAPRFRVYTSRDVLGVEVGGAAKNVIALAAGIADGLGFGDNARSGLITRGLHEITRLGAALGAEPRTFAGLSGMGDLVATCTSGHSRNRAVGSRIARGESLDAILASTAMVAEGVETTRSMHGLAARLGVHLPITAEVHSVLFEGKAPRDAVESLMVRDLKDERA